MNARPDVSDDAPLIVAIDGPAGAGKSTVGRALAARLGLQYLDTGAMYRAVTFAALRRGLDPHDDDAVAEVAETIDMAVGDAGVHVDGVDATSEIRGREVTSAVSAVAANSRVRAELVRRQRSWVADQGGGVVEGRDIGTVVFPHATLKLYVTASPRSAGTSTTSRHRSSNATARTRHASTARSPSRPTPSWWTPAR